MTSSDTLVADLKADGMPAYIAPRATCKCSMSLPDSNASGLCAESP